MCGADARAQGVPVARTAGGPYVYGSNGDRQERYVVNELKQQARGKNGENAFLLRVASVAKRKCDL